MEEGSETTKKANFEGEYGTALQVATDTLPSTEFVKVEKNLASLGFFTPSSKRIRSTQEKSFTITTCRGRDMRQGALRSGCWSRAKPPFQPESCRRRA